MTVVELRPKAAPEPPKGEPDGSQRREPDGFWQAHWQSCLLLAGLLVMTGIVSTLNMGEYPARFKDEGVYIAQAWAVQELGQLANYTYWYDHPPLGWVQLSAWTALTDAFDRHDGNPLVAGREFMVVVRLAAVTLVFLLARRLGMRRSWATVAAALLALSPLAVHFGRYVLLDSIALPWVLAGFFLVFSPRRHMTAVVGASLCFTVAVLTKETMVVMAPALLYALWLNFRDSANRKYAVICLLSFVIMATFAYPLYAILKGELMPGEGHVSLWGALQWQLVSRAGSGSVFDSGSDAHETVATWLAIDGFLPIAGAVASVIALGSRRMRPISAALIIQLLMLLRTGYLPFMYVIGLLPFAALTIAGVGNMLTPRLEEWRQQQGWRSAATAVGALAVTAASIGSVSMIEKPWQDTLAYQFRTDADQFQRDAVDWMDAHVARDATLVVEGESWLDYVNRGFPRQSVIWVYKVDTDIEVQRTLGDWRNIDYLVLSGVTLVSEDKSSFPRVFEAVDSSDIVTAFGSGEDRVEIRKVRK